MCVFELSLELIKYALLGSGGPEERFRIVRSVGEECIQEDELLDLLTKKPEPICCDGFEPSRGMHIAQVCISFRAVNVAIFCEHQYRPKHPTLI